jgi:hypothetical protein
MDINAAVVALSFLCCKIVGALSTEPVAAFISSTSRCRSRSVTRGIDAASWLQDRSLSLIRESSASFPAKPLLLCRPRFRKLNAAPEWTHAAVKVDGDGHEHQARLREAHLDQDEHFNNVSKFLPALEPPPKVTGDASFLQSDRSKRPLLQKRPARRMNHAFKYLFRHNVVAERDPLSFLLHYFTKTQIHQMNATFPVLLSHLSVSEHLYPKMQFLTKSMKLQPSDIVKYP